MMGNTTTRLHGGAHAQTTEEAGDAGSRRSSSSSTATSLTIQYVLPTADLHQKAVRTQGEQIATVNELLADTEDEEEKVMYRAKLTELRNRKLERLDDVYTSTITTSRDTITAP